MMIRRYDVFFFVPPRFFSCRRSINTGLLYWATSRHKLFLDWPVSRCACGRKGVSPDLLLPGWEAAGWHGGRAVEGLSHGCRGERDLRTAGWPQKQ